LPRAGPFTGPWNSIWSPPPAVGGVGATGPPGPSPLSAPGASRPAHTPSTPNTAPPVTVANPAATTHRSATARGNQDHDISPNTHRHPKYTTTVTATATTDRTHHAIPTPPFRSYADSDTNPAPS
jgi:hypothetical protein